MCTTLKRPYLVSVDTVAKKVVWYRPDCHLWSCEDCAENNRVKWLSIVVGGMKDLIDAAPQLRFGFCTITAPRWSKTNLQAIKFFRQDWPKLQRRLKREYGAFDYVAMPELGEKYARYHHHLITSVLIDERWLKDNCASCGLGYIADSQEAVNPGKVAFYTAKYIAKSLKHGQKWPKTLHRVRTSQTWPRREIDPVTCEISLSPISVQKAQEMSATLAAAGYVFVSLTTGEVSGNLT